MRRAAFIALSLALLLSGAVIYQLVNSSLDVKPMAPQVIAGSEQAAEFQRLQDAISNRALIGTAIERSLPGRAEDYSLVVFTLSVSNHGFLPANMVELQVSPATGDMLFYTDGSAQGLPPSIDIAAGATRSLRCVLLTKGAPQRPVRELFVTYYIWGNPFKVKVTAG